MRARQATTETDVRVVLAGTSAGSAHTTDDVDDSKEEDEDDDIDNNGAHTLCHITI